MSGLQPPGPEDNQAAQPYSGHHDYGGLVSPADRGHKGAAPQARTLPFPRRQNRTAGANARNRAARQPLQLKAQITTAVLFGQPGA